MSKKDNLYITMLRYGRERMESGESVKSISEMSEYLRGEGHEFHKSQLDNIFVDAFQRFTVKTGGSTQYTLTMGSYFNLLEHEELQEARQSSADAKRMAFWAIIISGALAAGSIGLQVY